MRRHSSQSIGLPSGRIEPTAPKGMAQGPSSDTTATSPSRRQQLTALTHRIRTVSIAINQWQSRLTSRSPWALLKTPPEIQETAISRALAIGQEFRHPRPAQRLIAVGASPHERLSLTKVACAGHPVLQVDGRRVNPDRNASVSTIAAN